VAADAQRHTSPPPPPMQLLVIRHAIAEDRETFAATGEDDARRPLTKRGERKMKDVVAGLRRIVPTIDVLGASSLLRAQQTAEIVARAYGDLPVHTVAALAPESEPKSLVRWLRQHSNDNVVAVVGHEPHLDLPARVDDGGATLQWLLTPSQLRRMGR
jgi:phosphohistidine phosphatase